MDTLNTLIENLYYGTVENEIADFFDLGMVNSSNLPIEFSEISMGSYFITGTKKQGDFYISIRKLNSGKYSLYVTASKLKDK